MSGGRGFSERHSAKKGPPRATTDVEARYPSASLPPSSQSTLPSGRVVCVPFSLFGSNSGLSCKTREGQCSSSSLPSPAERQLDHLRHHYLSLFLCNFPSRTPTCQMTKPKSHFLAAHARAPSRPERGTFERADDRERGRRTTIGVASSTMRHRPSSERGPHSFLPP